MTKRAKEKHLRGIRKCMFCSQSGGMSKEHVFGEWLKPHFPRSPNVKHESVNFSYADDDRNRPVGTRRLKQGHSGSVKLRTVCQSCNNEWLSRLEGRVKPILPALIYGKKLGLLPEAQATLATWATKTVMVATQRRPNDALVPQAERTWLMDNLAPPKNWFVWFAAYHGGAWSNLRMLTHAATLEASSVVEENSPADYVINSVFGMGHVVFCVVNTSSPGVMARCTGLESKEGLFQLWPPHARSIPWPPFRIIGEALADSLVHILHDANIVHDPNPTKVSAKTAFTT